MRHDLLNKIVFTALIANACVLQAAEPPVTDPAVHTDTATTLTATETATGTGVTTNTTVRRPLSRALSRVEQNLEKNPDNKGLKNARERLLRNQAKIEERRSAKQDSADENEATDAPDGTKAGTDKAVTRQQRFDAQQAKREEHFERKQEKREAHFEYKQLERTAKAERPEKVERAEKVERPEKVEQAAKVERPEKQGR